MSDICTESCVKFWLSRVIYHVTDVGYKAKTKNIETIIMEQTKFMRFKRITNKRILLVILMLMMACGSLNLMNTNASTCQNIVKDSVEVKTVVAKVSEQDMGELTKDSLKQALIVEVSKYVKKFAPRSHNVIPKYLVHAGLTNNIDICFMMAQTQIETAYGTLGAGRETSRRSMFGVIKRHYPNYEDAIDHYCQMLKKYYLVRGRTEKHLMTKYVTGSGARYASDPGYERALTAAYNHIKRTTSIYNLQKEYKKL